MSERHHLKHLKGLKHFKNDLLNVKGSYYMDYEFYFRINVVPYDILAEVQTIVKIVDDTESELITLFVLEIPSAINDNHYLGYVSEDAKYSKARKGNIVGFTQDNIYRFGFTLDKQFEKMEFTKDISLTYLLYIQNMRK